MTWNKKMVMRHPTVQCAPKSQRKYFQDEIRWAPPKRPLIFMYIKRCRWRWEIMFKQRCRLNIRWSVLVCMQPKQPKQRAYTVRFFYKQRSGWQCLAFSLFVYLRTLKMALYIMYNGTMMVRVEQPNCISTCSFFRFIYGDVFQYSWLWASLLIYTVCY